MFPSCNVAIEMVYKSTNGAPRYQVHVIDEVGPSCATNMCYMKGRYLDCNTNGEVANFGRYMCMCYVRVCMPVY